MARIMIIPAGLPGEPGEQGPPGTSSVAHAYRYDSGPNPPPGAGKLRSNQDDTALVTRIYIAYEDATGLVIAPLLRTITAGDTLTVQNSGDATRWAGYQVLAGATDVPGGSYVDVPVSYTGGSGGIPKANTPISVFHTFATGGVGAGGSGFVSAYKWGVD